jgi:hypothetical protein
MKTPPISAPSAPSAPRSAPCKETVSKGLQTRGQMGQIKTERNRYKKQYPIGLSRNWAEKCPQCPRKLLTRGAAL